MIYIIVSRTLYNNKEIINQGKRLKNGEKDPW